MVAAFCAAAAAAAFCAAAAAAAFSAAAFCAAAAAAAFWAAAAAAAAALEVCADVVLVVTVLVTASAKAGKRKLRKTALTCVNSFQYFMTTSI